MARWLLTLRTHQADLGRARAFAELVAGSFGLELVTVRSEASVEIEEAERQAAARNRALGYRVQASDDGLEPAEDDEP